MMRHALVLALFVVAGCGGSGSSGFTAGHPPARQPPANAVGGFSIQLPDVVLPPGGEVQPCYIFPLVVSGPSHVVGGATLNATPGMHHGNITTRPKTGDGIRACSDADSAGGSEALDILNGGGVLFGSSTQIVGQEWQSFPAGMGYRIKEGYEIVARMHYLNASAAPLTVAPSYQWYTIDESTLQKSWRRSSGSTRTSPFPRARRDGDRRLPISIRRPSDASGQRAAAHAQARHRVRRRGHRRSARRAGVPEVARLQPGHGRAHAIRSSDRSRQRQRRHLRLHVAQHAEPGRRRGRRHQRDVHDVRLRLSAVGGVFGAGGAGHLRDVDAVLAGERGARLRRVGVDPAHDAPPIVARRQRRARRHEVPTPTAVRIASRCARTAAWSSQL